jgi:hypothetical protein
MNVEARRCQPAPHAATRRGLIPSSNPFPAIAPVIKPLAKPLAALITIPVFPEFVCLI